MVLIVSHGEFEGYTVIDLETTGISPAQNNRVVELAVVYVSMRGQIQDRWSTLIDPRRDVGPTHVHGISATDVLGAPTFAEIAPYVLRALSRRVLVAHNASFDARFMASELVRSGVALDDRTLPALCTMRWSPWFLNSPSRRLVDCCAACGISLTSAHSASGDAKAAQLLSHYLQACEFRPPWTVDLSTAQEFVWPTFRGDFAELRLKHRAEMSARARSDNWLDGIVSQMPRAAHPKVDAYLNVLEMALLDGFLAEHEKAALIEAAGEHGLSRGQVMDIHAGYLRALAEVALADGVVTSRERADLELVARLLGLPGTDVDHALTAARDAIEVGVGVEQLSTAGIGLRRGDRIAFTGALKQDRSAWEMRVVAAGLQVDSVSKKTVLLVAADPNSQSGKAAKARSYGIPIVNESGFNALFGTFTQSVEQSGCCQGSD